MIKSSHINGYWLKIFSAFISTQLIVQLLGFASGILLIRTLSKEEYAFFTLANTMQAAMNVLADSGVSSALSSIGGKVWKDPYRFSQLITTAMQWRRYLAIAAVMTVTPITLWILSRNGASPIYAAVLVVGILIELDFYLRIGVLSPVLRLRTQVGRLQKLALVGAGSRLMLLTASFGFLSAGIGVFSSTIASGLQALLLRKWVKTNIDLKASPNKEDNKEVRQLVVSQIPHSLFYCVQGQLAVWLISLFGNVENIAEIGALSRLAIIFSIATSLMTNVVLPGFSRCQTPNILFKRYFQILGGYFVFSAILIFLAVVFPKELLWILGGQYSHLQGEVLLLVINSVAQATLGLTWSLNLSKGWVLSGWLALPLGVLTQVLLLSTLDISTISGIFILSILATMPGFLLNFYMAYEGFSKLKSTSFDG